MGDHQFRRRPYAAGIVGVLMFGVCAVPLYWTSLFAWASFTGCFISCSEPEPAVGIMWGAVALLSLIAPFAAGALAGGYRVRLATTIALCVAAGIISFLVVGRGAV
jgi:hypothetical protein